MSVRCNLTDMDQEYTYLVLVRLLSLLEREDFLVNNRVDVVGLDSADHILEQITATNVHSTDSADVAQGIQNLRLALGFSSTKESDDADDSLELDSLNTLLQSARSANFQNVFDTNSVGKLAGRLTPIRVVSIIDDMVGTKLLQDLFLVGGGGGSDDSGTSSLSKL